MGKVRRKRTKLHTEGVKPQNSTNAEKMAANSASGSTSLQLPDSVFSKVDIDLSSLQRQLGSGDQRDSDVKSGITSKSLRGLNLKKIDKRKLRREVWMKKVDIIQAVRKEAKEKKRRQKTAIVGDMKPLEDTLPTLDLLLKETPSRHDRSEDSSGKPKGIKTSHTRKQEMLKDISVFHQVLEHPEYKANPLSTISQHLQNKLKQEEAMDT